MRQQSIRQCWRLDLKKIKEESGVCSTCDRKERCDDIWPRAEKTTEEINQKIRKKFEAQGRTSPV